MDRRPFAHHLTFYGFLLCFAATSIASVYHFALGREAPYPWWDIPVLLGTLGGLGLLVGPVLLLQQKARRDEAMCDTRHSGMERAFIFMLFLLGLTGLALSFRASSMMGTLLAIHLGVVFVFFVTIPYGKFARPLPVGGTRALRERAARNLTPA